MLVDKVMSKSNSANQNDNIFDLNMGKYVRYRDIINMFLRIYEVGHGAGNRS